jgi:hypothetical protein
MFRLRVLSFIRAFFIYRRRPYYNWLFLKIVRLGLGWEFYVRRFYKLNMKRLFSGEN